MTWLNDNAAAIQAIGSVGAIFVAIWIAQRQERVARRGQEDARRRAARVLAMELLPTVKAIHGELEKLLGQNWNETDHLNITSCQRRRMKGPLDVLERLLDRLPVLDDETMRSVLRLVSTLRAYESSRLQTDLEQAPRHDELAQRRLGDELAQRRELLEAASQHAAEAVERLQKIATV